MAEREEKNEKDLEALLRERTRIDELLKSRYSREVTDHVWEIEEIISLMD